MIVNAWLNRLKFVLLLIAASVFLSNCALFDLKKEIAELKTVY
jgi:hypothetical protein